MDAPVISEQPSNSQTNPMAIELTSNSISALCNGTNVPKPILQILGYEAVQIKNNTPNYRLVLSDGVHMNSYFYISFQFHDLVEKKKVKYGTILRLEKYEFIDGENVSNQNPRWILFIQNMTILINRDVVGDPRPLMNVVKKEEPLINLNRTSCPTRIFNSFKELRSNLITVIDLNCMPNGKCSFILQLSVNFKYPIKVHNTCKILNITMVDNMDSLVNVSAFNSLADKLNDIFEPNKKYYVTDFKFKRDLINELQFQPDSVIIECIVQPPNVNNLNVLLKKNVNTFSDFIGVCYKIGQVELCNTLSQKEVPKLDISLIDTSMESVTLKVWGENVEKLVKKFKGEPLVVMVKQAILKEFNGVKFFSMMKFSKLSIDPKTDEALKLKQWYNETPKSRRCDTSTLKTTINFN